MNNSGQIKLLIGIDDTDNADSRGTGFHARQLAHKLESKGFGKVHGITRHQLFVNPAIRYTSQNSSACIFIVTDKLQELTSICEKYLSKESAPGSDAGLCLIPFDEVPEQILEWGLLAKNTVLHMNDANALAAKMNIYLKGFTGNHEGIIGALAAVGLHACGNDGRYIWRKGIKELREMEAGIFRIQQLIDELKLDEICTMSGEHPKKYDRIAVGEWIRPIRKDHKAVLITERTDKYDEYEWKLTGKEYIRSIS